jgi:hypothetical protein
MQLLVRGPMFAVLIALIVRMLQAPLLLRTLAVGLTLSIVGGGAALILPNPCFPDAVRIAHLVAVATSNFIFGVLWILSAPPRAALKGCATDVLTADLR